MNKLLVISSAPLIFKSNTYFAYSPYESEMQIWAQYSNSIAFCCPVWLNDRKLLVSEVQFKIDTIYKLKEFDLKSLKNCFKAMFYSIINCYIIFKAIKKAEHIHLRCPGNMTLLACFVQILFPHKLKTAKYAGNWDPNSIQPWSYKMQKWILSNTFLTRNMQVLVYGEWPNQTKNIKPFFTATYSQKEIQTSDFRLQTSNLKEPFRFIFVGALSKGKQPLYALQIIDELKRKDYTVSLDFYGEGIQRANLELYMEQNYLASIVSLKGNQTKATVEKAYKESHFLILPSKSEGWPKVVAEAMFWGCLPIVTKISCVPYMLNHGDRGILMEEILEKDVLKIETLLKSSHLYDEKVHNAMKWSREFTLDKFENEIKKLLQ